MSDEEILEQVKAAIGVTGKYQDKTLIIYIKEVIDFMVNAGVDENVAKAESSLGVIARGVSDLWDYDKGELSSHFQQRVIQLSLKVVDENV